MYVFTFTVSVGSSLISTGRLTVSGSLSSMLIGSSTTDGLAVLLSNGLVERRLISLSFGIFGILGKPDVNGISFLAKQFGTFDPNRA